MNFQVLTEGNNCMIFFWVVTLCMTVDWQLCFRWISFPHLQAVESAPTLYKSVTLKMEVTCSYKMSVSHHNATQCQNYEIYHLRI